MAKSVNMMRSAWRATDLRVWIYACSRPALTMRVHRYATRYLHRHGSRR